MARQLYQPTFRYGGISNPDITPGAKMILEGLQTPNRMIDRANKEEDRQNLLKQQALHNQMAKEGLDLRKQGLTLQEAEAERRAGIDTAKLIMQADAAEAQAAHNLWSKKNANERLALQKQRIENEENESKKLWDLKAGEAYGGSIALETQRPGEDRIEMKDIETLGYTPVEPDKIEAQKAYMEYLSKNDPDYEKGMTRKYGEKAWSMMKVNPMRVPSTLASAIFGSTSSASKEQEVLRDLETPKKEGLKSKEEFMKTYTRPAQSYSHLPKLQKEVRTPAVEDVSEKELYEQGNRDLEAYFQTMKQQGKTPTDAQVLGARLEIQKRINNILDTRKLEAKDARDLTTFVFKENYKTLKKTEQKAYLERLKSELNRTNDALKAKKFKLEIDKLQKEIND